jgi:hypothetical protein
MQTASPATGRHNTASVANYYSMRRLSPYQGTIQIIELAGFRAMSVDGFTWEVRIENAGMRPTRAVWRDDGLPDMEVGERLEPFLGAMRNRPTLPFPLADSLELWLLDAGEKLPLALLLTALPHMAPPNTVETQWRAAFAEEDCFIAPSLQAAALRPPEHPFIAHHEILNRCVRAAAGTRPSAQWFRRNSEGDAVGSGGSGLEPALLGRTIEASWFPELLVSEEWGSDVETGLARDYHDWLAPALLTHSNLRRATRDRLERAACSQAEKLYRVRHLLPEIVNPELVDVALVEAVLRRNGGASAA